MIYVGIDDTDIVGTPGTNQLARAILKRLGACAAGSMICRHQLFFDPRVPYTSKNGSASILLPALDDSRREWLISEVRDVMRSWFVAGSDPGLAVASAAPLPVQEFADRCKHEVVTQDEARAVAAGCGVHLEGLGGTEQGIIGALAAVGLIVTGDDGRVVHLVSWPYPDDFSGPRNVDEIHARGVEVIRTVERDNIVTGSVDIGHHLRPNLHGGRIVLFVEPTGTPSVPWRALKLN